MPDAIDERVLEHIVALELRVAPDAGRLAEQLRQAPFERLVQLRHPALLVFPERGIVQVGIADEHVEIQSSSCPSGEQDVGQGILTCRGRMRGGTA